MKQKYLFYYESFVSDALIEYCEANDLNECVCIHAGHKSVDANAFVRAMKLRGHKVEEHDSFSCGHECCGYHGTVTVHNLMA